MGGGGLVSTLTIADALDEHGPGEWAGELREKVAQYHRSQNEVMEAGFGAKGRAKGWCFWHALQTLCHSRATRILLLRS